MIKGYGFDAGTNAKILYGIVSKQHTFFSFPRQLPVLNHMRILR